MPLHYPILNFGAPIGSHVTCADDYARAAVDCQANMCIDMHWQVKCSRPITMRETAARTMRLHSFAQGVLGHARTYWRNHHEVRHWAQNEGVAAAVAQSSPTNS